MTHGELQDALDALEFGMGAAEAHGRLCGALCVRRGYDAADWLGDLAADSAGASQESPGQPLHEVHRETLEALDSAEFDFAPLLPGDDAPIGERVAALGAWSDGFLYGIGSAARGRALPRTGSLGEFLDDLSSIARVELEAGRGASDAESDFAELYEFVRAGTQLAWMELASLRSHAA